jgi:hypothetical protein
MSYGQNQPWGLMAVKTTNGSTWNGQTSQYLIQSGYVNNIFKGDPVYLGNDGYIHNLSDVGAGSVGAHQILGVFNGCSFQTSVATNPIDPASPGRSYWPAGTVTFNNIDATCDIIDDPSVIFNIQADAAGVPFNAQGATAAVLYTLMPGSLTNPDGNTNTGVSKVVLNTGTIDTNNLNLKILRFVPVAGNIPVGNGNNRVPYNNVEVIIQNHSFASRPTPY